LQNIYWRKVTESPQNLAPTVLENHFREKLIWFSEKLGDWSQCPVKESSKQHWEKRKERRGRTEGNKDEGCSKVRRKVIYLVLIWKRQSCLLIGSWDIKN